MKALALNSSGDLNVANRTLSYVKGPNAILQKLQIGLRSFLGEWFLDVRWGMPFYTKILVKNPRQSDVEAVYRAAILSCDGVTGVTAISSSFDRTKRVMQLSFTATIDDGTEILFNDSFVIGAIATGSPT